MNSIQQHRKIRSTMMLHGVTQAQIAERENVSENYVTRVVTGRNVGHRIRRAIAKACGVPVTELWPDEEEPDLPAAA